jgi:hypothetical protein
MNGGLLDGLKDEKLMARAAERSRIVTRIAEQTGCSRREATDMLFHFEFVTSSEGHELH